MKKRNAALLLVAATVLCLLSGTARAAADTVSVGTLTELQAALSNDDVTTVIVTAQITLPGGTTLEGGGRTVRVEKPYLSEAGTVITVAADVSNHGVFSIASGSVTIRNMTVMGGNSAAIDNGGTLTMQGVTVTRSCRGIQNNGMLVMKNCNVVRNAAHNGGGLDNGETAVLDGCSLSENRSLGSMGGGGAAENRGAMYVNNSVIANNSSTEIGGAINNYTGALYLMNTTVSGNVTTAAASNGGGVGINGGTVTAVNSIFADNYYISGSTTTPSDIGVFSGATPALAYCLFGAVIDSSGTSVAPGTGSYSTCKPATGDTFANYRDDGILSREDGRTVGYPHSLLVSKNDDPYARYAPLAPTGSPAATGGVYATYFDYSDLSNIKMSYQAAAGSGHTALTADPAGADQQVTGSFEDDTRRRFVIGASGDGATAYTVTLGAGFDAAKGTVTGASIYGDSYPSGTSVTVTALPKDGFYLKEWSVVTGAATTTVTTNPYVFTLQSDVTLTPSFLPGYTVTFHANGHGVAPPPLNFDPSYTGLITEPAAPMADGYAFGGWYQEPGCTNPWNFATDTVSQSITLYAKWTQMTYGVALDPSTDYDFPAAAFGYAAPPTAHSVTVKNGGNQATGPLTIALSGAGKDSFSLSRISITDIAPSGTDSFTVQPVAGLSAGVHTATVTVSGGADITPGIFDVSFTVNAQPTVTVPSQPQTVTVMLGRTARLSVSASNAGGYQWYRSIDGGARFTPIDGATSPSYTSAPVTMENSGYQYYCQVSGASGTTPARSPVFTLNVTEPPVIPHTGDAARPLAWLGLALLAGAGLVANSVFIRRKKKR